MQGAEHTFWPPEPCFSFIFDYKARFRTARLKGCRGGSFRLKQKQERDCRSARRHIFDTCRPTGDLSQMPKLKTKSGAKKRFKITATGKVIYAQRGKRHGMIKRSPKQVRNLRGTNVLFKSDGDNVIKFFLPNG
jgi:large subunit ribosomal protein L35